MQKLSVPNVLYWLYSCMHQSELEQRGLNETAHGTTSSKMTLKYKICRLTDRSCGYRALLLLRSSTPEVRRRHLQYVVTRVLIRSDTTVAKVPQSCRLFAT